MKRNFLLTINRLGLSNCDNFHLFSSPSWRGVFPLRIERLLDVEIKPVAIFELESKPIILFFDSLENTQSTLTKVWNLNESPVAIFFGDTTVEVYNAHNYIVKEKNFSLLGNSDIIDIFSYDNILNGSTWDWFNENYQSNRVDKNLLNNILAVRDELGINSPQLFPDTHIINFLIGKIIFIRYLIDRKVHLDFEKKGVSRLWSNNDLCDLLADKSKFEKFLDYLGEKFRGDLFPLTKEEFKSIPLTWFDVLIRLIRGDNISTGQLSLFELYDFSIIPVEFISNIYELFIGTDKQQQEGAYYTPLFLVDYVLSSGVKKSLLEAGYEEFKIIDPACGSGVFLVEALRLLIEKRINTKESSRLIDHEDEKQVLKNIASSSIFGVDKDKSAVNVAVFSIYLTLLDYQNPSDIESFTFPSLIDTNFFVSDFFDLEAPFNNCFSGVSFTHIVGNPPWKRGSKNDALFIKYIDKKNRKEKGQANRISISGKEIAQAYMLRVGDFCGPETSVAFIITSKALYNKQGKAFRKYFLEKFSVKKVLELAAVRREVFVQSNDSSIGPAAVIFYNLKQNDSNENHNDEVEYISLKPNLLFSLFRLFIITKLDRKVVSQKLLEEYDYLFKVLVYGSYLDFNLIKRLKNDYVSIFEIIENEEFTYGQGVQLRGGDRRDATEYHGMPFVNSRKDIDPFYIRPITQYFEREYLHRKKKKELFVGSKLLMLKGFKKDFRAVTVFTTDTLLFTDSVTSITSDSTNHDILLIIGGILSSSLFSYLNLHTFSSSGIEREQAHNVEKFSVPFVNDNSIGIVYKEILERVKAFNKLDYSISRSRDNEKYIQIMMLNLDMVVFNAFKISKSEEDLINYTLSVTIPEIMRKNSRGKRISTNFIEKLLMSYIEIVKERFDYLLEELDKKFDIEIRYNERIIAVFFRFSDKEGIKFSFLPKESMTKFFLSLGFEKLSSNLFISKDIRGFDKDGFYIIKLSEHRMWQPAIAHLDTVEIVDAILRSGKRKHYEH